MMDNIVEISPHTLLWLSRVLDAAIANDQSVRLMTGTDETGPYFKVSRGQSMWSVALHR